MTDVPDDYCLLCCESGYRHDEGCPNASRSEAPAEPDKWCEDWCGRPATTTRTGNSTFNLCQQCADTWDRITARLLVAAPVAEQQPDALRDALEQIAGLTMVEGEYLPDSVSYLRPRDYAKRVEAIANAALRTPSVPKLNIRCETEDQIGATYLDVVRVEAEDDGSFTAVTNHWPVSSVPPQPMSDAERARLRARFGPSAATTIEDGRASAPSAALPACAWRSPLRPDGLVNLNYGDTLLATGLIVEEAERIAEIINALLSPATQPSKGEGKT